MSETTENEADVVSQDNIDQLPSQAEEVATDVPADRKVSEAAGKGDGDDAPGVDAESAEEVDRLFDAKAEGGESASEKIPDRVILEEVAKKQEKGPPKGKTRWPPGKHFWIVISIVCVLGVAINVPLWFRDRNPVDYAEPIVLSFPVVHTPVISRASMFLTSPRSISLKSFIITAPLKRKDITYVAADISIELTTEKAAVLIKDYAPFYRNIIYNVIRDALKALDKTKISEISLKIAILKALNGAVPERSVKDVIVDTFVMF